MRFEELRLKFKQEIEFEKLIIIGILLTFFALNLTSCSSTDPPQSRDMTFYEQLKYSDNKHKEYVKLLEEGNVEKIDAYFKTNPEMYEKYGHSSFSIGIAIKNNDMELVRYFCNRGLNVNEEKGGRSVLYEAVINNNTEFAEFFIHRGSDVNHANDSGETPLYTAAENNNVEMMQCLISNGADPDARADDRSTPLLAASRYGNLKAVQYLLEKGADVSVEDKKGRNILDLAVKSGNLKLIEFLEKRKSGVSYGDSIVSEAVNSGNFNIVKRFVEKGFKFDRKSIIEEVLLDNDEEENRKIIKFLAEKGAEIDGKHTSEIPILWYAVQRGKPKIVKVLLELGADPNQKSFSLRPIVFCPVTNSCPPKYETEMLKLFINHGAKIDVKDVNGNSLLDLAAYRSNVESVKFLESRGVRFSRPNVIGPLHFAACGKKLDVLKYFIKKGNDVNKEDSEGNSPMHYAVAGVSPGRLNPNYHFSGHTEIDIPNIDLIKYLTSKGAKVNLKNKKGQEPIHFAAAYPSVNDNSDILEFLVSRGGDVNAEDKNGNTPLIMFFYQSNYTMYRKPAKTLINLGADVNARNKKGESPLYFAIKTFCKSKKPDAWAINFLLSKGAYPGALEIRTIIDHKAWNLIPLIIYQNKHILITLISAIILFTLLLLYLFRSNRRKAVKGEFCI